VDSHRLSPAVAARRFAPDGSAYESAPFLLTDANDYVPGENYEHYTEPSLAMSSGLVHMVCISYCEECRYPLPCCVQQGDCPCQKGVNGAP